MFHWLKRLAGIDPAKDQDAQAMVDGLWRYNQGPADARYLVRLFPKSIFTKKFTKARRRVMTEKLRRLRPEQRAIVYARGWNKGVTV